MKLTKILLIAALILVGSIFAFTQISSFFSGANDTPTFLCSDEVLEISVDDSREILLSGITAHDKQDGDLTDQILIQGISKFIEGPTARVTYLVFDSDGNMATYVRQIRYTDYESPKFTITAPLVYHTNESIGLLDRIRVTDAIDGDITGSVRVSQMSATSDSEVYTVDLQVTNSMGDTARVTLPVIRQSGSVARPDVYLTSYLIYLEPGDSFVAGEYLLSVTTADGRGDLNRVEITGLVDTHTPGTYMVYYRYTQGTYTGTAVLTVVVE